MRRSSGLSIAEIVLALGLLGVLITALLGLFTQLLASSTKNVDQSTAIQIAEDALDDCARRDPALWSLDTQKVIYSHSTESNAPMRCKVTAQLVNGSDNPMGDLYRVEASVTWWGQSQGKSREGFGQQEVHLNRMLYVESMKPGP